MASNQRRKGISVVCGLAAAATTGAIASHAGAVVTLFNSNGFEPTAGYIPTQSLVGQPPTAGASQQWSGTSGGTPIPIASVQTYATTFGSNTNLTNTQLAILSDSGINGSAGSVADYYPNANLGPLAYNPVASSNPIVDVVFTMAVTAATSGEPVFGVVAFSSSGAQVGELLVDGTSGAIIGSSAPATFTPTLAPGAFYSYELQLNYASQTYNLYEAAPGSSAFTNLIGTSPFQSSASNFSYAALTSFSLSGSTLASGFGLFDDYSVTATVPEPTMASLALGGAAMVVGGRKRRRVSGR